MPQVSKHGKPRRKPQANPYIHRTNAICITVYHPQGENIPEGVREEAAQAVLDVAVRNGLLIGTATT